MLFAGLDVQKVKDTLLNINANHPIKFYNANEKIHLTNLRLTSLEEANIVLFSAKQYTSKMTIVDSYKKLKFNKNSIGAIYLKKGRTQIVFIKERLERNGLRLNAKFKKHLLNEWQLNPQLLINNLR
jgi:hypothetical protein